MRLAVRVAGAVIPCLFSACTLEFAFPSGPGGDAAIEAALPSNDGLAEDKLARDGLAAEGRDEGSFVDSGTVEIATADTAEATVPDSADAGSEADVRTDVPVVMPDTKTPDGAPFDTGWSFTDTSGFFG